MGTRSGTARWLYEEVSDLDLDGDHLMLLDHSDRPHIVFISEGIRYAVWNGDEWEVEAVPGGERPYPNRSIAADIDISGNPHIVYCTESGRTNHTWKDGVTWHSRTVIEGESAFPTIAMDGSGNAHIAFLRTFPGQLIYANCSKSDISTQVIGRGDIYGLSMVLDSSDNVIISASNLTDEWAAHNKLELYRSGASGWSKETIPQGNGTYYYTNLAIGNDDLPYISFTRGHPQQALIMLESESDGWVPRIVVENISSSRFSFALDRYGGKHFISDDNYTVLSKMGKSSSIIEIPGFTLSRSCLAVDLFGYVHISSSIGEEGDTGICHITHSLENERPYAMIESVGYAELGSIIRLDGSSSRDNVALERYNWTVDYWTGGMRVWTSNLEGMAPEIDAIKLGTLKVILRVMDASGNWDEDQIEIEIKDTIPPTAIAGDDVTVPQNTLITFNASNSYDQSGELTFRWFIPQNRWVHKAAYTHLFTQAGTFIVNLTVTDPSKNQGNDSLVVTILDTTTPGIVGFNDQEVIEGRTLSLNASGCSDNVGIISYTWIIQRGIWNRTLQGKTNRTKLTKLGDYSVTLIVKDQAGNSNSTTFKVECKERMMSKQTRDAILAIGTSLSLLVGLITFLVLWTKASVQRPPPRLEYRSTSDDHFGTGIYFEGPINEYKRESGGARASIEAGGSAVAFTISSILFLLAVTLAVGLGLSILLIVLFLFVFQMGPSETMFFSISFILILMFIVSLIGVPFSVYNYSNGKRIRKLFLVSVLSEGIEIISRMDDEFPVLVHNLPLDQIAEVRPVSDREWRKDLRMSNPFRALSRKPKDGASIRFMGGMRRRDIVTIHLKRPVVATQHILIDNMAGSHFMARRAPVITGIELIIRLATKTVFSVLERKEMVERFFVSIPPDRYEEFMIALTRAIEDSKSDILPTQQSL